MFVPWWVTLMVSQLHDMFEITYVIYLGLHRKLQLRYWLQLYTCFKLSYVSYLGLIIALIFLSNFLHM